MKKHNQVKYKNATKNISNQSKTIEFIKSCDNSNIPGENPKVLKKLLFCKVVMFVACKLLMKERSFFVSINLKVILKGKWLKNSDSPKI